MDLFRLKQEQQDDDDDTYVDRGSPDPDARFGRKTPQKGFYGYKEHCAMDADSGIIVITETTPEQVADTRLFPNLVGRHPREVTADKGYDSKENGAILAAVGIKNGIIPRRRPRGRPPASRRERPAIERKFAEMKRFHGLTKARYWGLAKVTIQCLLIRQLPDQLQTAGGLDPVPKGRALPPSPGGPHASSGAELTGRVSLKNPIQAKIA